MTTHRLHIKPFRAHKLQAIAALLKSWQFWLILVSLTVVTQVLSSSRLVDGLRGAGLDTAVLLGEPPPATADIVVVEIDDESYRTAFAKSTPLDRETLKKLIGSVQGGEPAVIGIDLELTQPLAASGAGTSNIVWAAGLRQDENGDTYIKEFSGTVFGVAQVLRGRDGIVRRYATETTVDGQPYPTLAAQIAHEACLRAASRWEGCKNKESEHASLIRFGPERSIDRIPAWRVLELGDSATLREGDLFRGKVVLIGGTYLESRDEHVTPVGVRFGVYVQAFSVATELAGGGLTEPSHALLFVVKLIAGILVGMLAAAFVALVGVPAPHHRARRGDRLRGLRGHRELLDRLRAGADVRVHSSVVS